MNADQLSLQEVSGILSQRPLLMVYEHPWQREPDPSTGHPYYFNSLTDESVLTLALPLSPPSLPTRCNLLADSRLASELSTQSLTLLVVCARMVHLYTHGPDSERRCGSAQQSWQLSWRQCETATAGWTVMPHRPPHPQH